MVSCSLAWVSKAAYWFAGLAGGAFLSAAKDGAASRQAVVTKKTGIFGNGWDFMANLIMIFAGVQGKARIRKVMMLVYSSLLLAVLVLGAPYWLVRMATSGRYRAGLAGRLGR